MSDRNPTVATPAYSSPADAPALTTAETLHVLRTSTRIALAHAQLLQRRWWRGTLDRDQFEHGVDGIIGACQRLIVLAEALEQSERA